MIKEIKEFKWEEIFEEWKNICCRNFQELLSPVTVNNILIKKESLGEQPFFVHGYDWLSISKYAERTASIVENPIQWLYFGGNGTKKGTMTTAELLAEAKDDKEKLAAVWIGACVEEFERYHPDSWRGDSFRTLMSIKLALFKFEDRPMWHHAMRDLIPEIAIPYSLFEDIRPTSTRSFLELIAVTCSYVLNRYKIVLYQTVLPDGSIFTENTPT